MKSLLLAAAVALLAPLPSFPAPRLIGATPETRCDWGPISEIKAQPAELLLRTDAGPFKVLLGQNVKVAGADGRPLASVAELHAGQTVRVYYVIESGARALEIDVIP